MAPVFLYASFCKVIITSSPAPIRTLLDRIAPRETDNHRNYGTGIAIE